jgi:ADP-ribosylglycohydrolase
MSQYQEIARNLIPAIAYGDAAGLPFEAQPPQEHGSITGLRDTETNPFIGCYPAGTWSDDTHLTLAVAKSLIAAKRFDLESQADWHLEAYRHVKGATADPDMVPPLVTDGNQNGWGGSTTRSVERLAKGISPRGSGELGGAGNGVLMKMAPLVAWQVGNKIPTADAEQQLVDMTNMTHASQVAITTALTHRRYLERLTQGTDPTAALVMAYEEAPSLERFYKVDEGLYQSLGWLVAAGFVERPSRDKLLAAKPESRKPAFFGFFAPETLLMAYGSFALERAAPDSIFRAVELGGDSDSTGSIVAAMNVFADQASPVTEQPDYTTVFARSRLERISGELANTIVGSE